MGEITVKWRPQPRQLTFLRACGLAHPFDGGAPTKPKARVIGYGGSAGGGKSDALLMTGVIAGLTYPGIKVGYFRRTFTQLDGPGGAIMRSHELLNGWARWNGQQRRWTLPTGAIIQFCYCDSEKDVFNYQSQQFDIVLFDESTHFLRFQYRYMLTRNRATTNNPGFIPFMAMATNPGNVGHMWFRTEFIDIGEFEEPHEVEVETGQFETHIFIPAKLSDNRKLEQRNPTYRKDLETQPEIIRKQLLDGDWDALAGQYFPEWNRNVHVVKPFEIPKWWQKFRSLDYGLDCTACHWWAVDESGHLYIYRELHQSGLTLSKAAAKILEMTPADEQILYTTASPDLWNRCQDSGTSGEEIMRRAGLFGLVKADSRRVEGWRQLREYLDPYELDQNVVDANLKIFSHCTRAISHLPALLHDEHNPEDAASEPHEITHAPESIRYGVMSRPPLRSLTPQEQEERRLKRRQRMAGRNTVTGY